ncbi:uncharacterized protein MYCFIDRAFT_173701 [Pseudocercospora fijiensis CIRAD86]|uniref:Uncharacterized protein n=1 Tax=Pseudocercospora fijiensis (strain CIRAD86) TaxID=383855 RepID=M3A0W2_PSEFD|nr:uncharacterized protein MYCFIDRAFT_173701 [Pseudocercospora fijiensis CIRAD86]EME84774.1 hypothetical protein MYCFIDRAFT_173701 [Pseudocercospora fijiensis CIRAD86]
MQFCSLIRSLYGDQMPAESIHPRRAGLGTIILKLRSPTWLGNTPTDHTSECLNSPYLKHSTSLRGRRNPIIRESEARLELHRLTNACRAMCGDHRYFPRLFEYDNSTKTASLDSYPYFHGGIDDGSHRIALRDKQQSSNRPDNLDHVGQVTLIGSRPIEPAPGITIPLHKATHDDIFDCATRVAKLLRGSWWPGCIEVRISFGLKLWISLRAGTITLGYCLVVAGLEELMNQQ